MVLKQFGKKDDIINIRESARAIKNENGEIICIEGTVENIDDQKQKSENLLKAKKNIEP